MQTVPLRFRGPAMALFLAVVAMLPFTPALSGGYVFDDHIAIVDNPLVHGDFDPVGMLRSGFWGGRGENNSGSYRPLTVLSFHLDYQLGGGSPVLLHITNLLLHALCVLAIAWALRRRFGEGVAFATALAFATLAVHTENVASLVGRADTLACLFGVLAWATARTRRPLSCALLLCALLSKEVGVAFVGLIVIDECFFPQPGAPRRQRLWAVGLALAVLAAYLGLRLAALERVSAHVLYQSNPLVGVESLATRVYTAGALHRRSIETIVAPVSLSADYSYAEILPSESLWSFEVLTGLALWILLPAAALAFRRRSPGTSLGLFLYLAAHAPVSNLLFLVPTIFGERLLYIPSLGLTLAATTALAPLWPQRRRALIAVLAIVVLGNGVRSATRSFDWRSPRALFASAVKTTPLSARSWFNLGVAAMSEEKHDEAESYLRRSLEIYPSQALAHSYLGVILEKRGQPEIAHQEMYLATQMSRTCRLCAMNLVTHYMKYGFFLDAADAIERYGRASGDRNTTAELSQRLRETEKKARDTGEAVRPRLGPGAVP